MIHILIVEDDPMVAEINRRYLQQIEGFELVGIASSVEEVEPILTSKKVDLILLDIHMPGDNGWSLLCKMRGMGMEMDVIVITASCDKESIKKGLRFGAVDYIIKPFEFDRFKSALVHYQQEQILLDKQEKVNQSELDQLLLHKEQKESNGNELPKGLTRNTLQRVWKEIVAFGKQSFTTEELACRVGVSRVSMRKYVTFLAEIQVLETDFAYGSIGRPVLTHRLLLYNEERIHQYFH
jgi:two-component system, CitB family, response regulator MalR